MQSIFRNRLVERLLPVIPVIVASAIILGAWLIVLAPVGLLFEDAGLIVVPFLTLYSLLFLLSLLGMDVSEDPEPKADLDHLLAMKRSTGFPIRPSRGGTRHFARPPDDLIASLFRH